jgi:hypothetical protein
MARAAAKCQCHPTDAEPIHRVSVDNDERLTDNRVGFASGDVLPVGVPHEMAVPTVGTLPAIEIKRIDNLV